MRSLTIWAQFIKSCLESTYLLYILFALAVPTESPPSKDNIGTSEVTILFNNKETLSNGKKVRLVM